MVILSKPKMNSIKKVDVKTYIDTLVNENKTSHKTSQRKFPMDYLGQYLAEKFGMETMRDARISTLLLYMREHAARVQFNGNPYQMSVLYASRMLESLAIDDLIQFCKELGVVAYQENKTPFRLTLPLGIEFAIDKKSDIKTNERAILSPIPAQSIVKTHLDDEMADYSLVE